jgi:hypothetical protein
LEEGEGLLAEGLLGKVVLGEVVLGEVVLGEGLLGEGLLGVAVLTLKSKSSQARPLPSGSRSWGSLGSRSSAAWADCWEPKLAQLSWFACAAAGSLGWISCS